MKVAVQEVSVVTLELLSQHLCIKGRIHGVLYDAGLLPVDLPRHTSKTHVLNLHLQYNLLRLQGRKRGRGSLFVK